MEKDVKQLAEFEKQKDLFTREYNGVPYWQAIRFNCYEGIFTDRIEQQRIIREKHGYISAIRDFCKGMVYCIKSSMAVSKAGHADVLCFLANTDKDRFFEYWKMPDDINALHIRGGNNISELSPKDKICTLAPYLKANISFLVKKKLGLLRKDSKERAFIENLVEDLKKEYGNCVSADLLESQILRFIEYDRYYQPYFRKLFRRTEPKAMMVVWYYQWALMIAYRIAKQQGIKIIEFQHGVINNHEEYWFEDQRGINNYTPDYFLAYGKQHLQWTKMLPSTTGVSVGYPFQDELIEKAAGVSTEEKTVVIYPEDKREFEEVLNEFVNIAHERGYRILMKLHPLQCEHYEVYFPILAENPHIEIITDQSKGIYHWLKLGKHHIMANTTVGFEALAFPHTNICIAENVPHEQVQPLLDWGAARGFRNTEELLALIEQPADSRMTDRRKDVWEADSKEKIPAFLHELIKGA